LGEVFTLINRSSSPSARSRPLKPPRTPTSCSCARAAANNLLLEQQDNGVYLGERQMKWHDPAIILPERGLWQFGKAFCFYRQDGCVVGLSQDGLGNHVS
jgi:hypothetical protein